MKNGCRKQLWATRLSTAFQTKLLHTQVVFGTHYVPKTEKLGTDNSENKAYEVLILLRLKSCHYFNLLQI